MEGSAASLPSLRKLEFPASVTEALKLVHLQCEKMSKNSLSIPQELDQITEFVDDYVFGHPKNKKKLGSIQQLQIIQALIDYFSSDTEFSVLCSVFMVVFLAKGRQVEFKISTLSKLMSLNLGQGHKALLNCGALWWTQQPPGAEHCRDLTRSLINDCILLLPPTDNPMPLIPSKSPLLAGILLTYFSDIYPLPEMNRSFVAPPVELVRIAFCWLKDNLELTGAQPSETQGVVPMLGRSPISGLLVWTVYSPLVSSEQEKLPYSQLHFSLLQHITEENCEHSIPSNFLSNLTETLLATFNNGSFSEHQINQALDRFGQMLQAARCAKSRVDEDLVLLINQLPYNRLVNIILANIR